MQGNGLLAVRSRQVNVDLQQELPVILPMLEGQHRVQPSMGSCSLREQAAPSKRHSRAGNHHGASSADALRLAQVVLHEELGCLPDPEHMRWYQMAMEAVQQGDAVDDEDGRRAGRPSKRLLRAARLGGGEGCRLGQRCSGGDRILVGSNHGRIRAIR